MIVIQHHLEPDSGLYRLVVGEQVFEEGNQAYDEQGQKVGEPEKVLKGYANVRDFVFDAADPRWMTAEGSRRPEDEIAAEQRQIVKDALGQQGAPTPEVPVEPQLLPGVGEAL